VEEAQWESKVSLDVKAQEEHRDPKVPQAKTVNKVQEVYLAVKDSMVPEAQLVTKVHSVNKEELEPKAKEEREESMAQKVLKETAEKLVHKAQLAQQAETELWVPEVELVSEESKAL